MLHPGEIRAKDGDIHFISSRQLAHLYGVLPTDEVVIFDIRNPLHSPERMERFYPDVYHLYPLKSGEYRNIHELDEFQPLPFEKQPKSVKKLFK